MFNVGAPEILVILVVALVVLGPQRLPEAGRQLGKALAEFRRVRANVQQDLREVLDVDDIRQALDVRTMLDPQPARPSGSSRSSATAARPAGSSGLDHVVAPDGAPSVPDTALILTPTVDVPSPPDVGGRDALLDAGSPPAAPMPVVPAPAVAAPQAN